MVCYEYDDIVYELIHEFGKWEINYSSSRIVQEIILEKQTTYLIK